MPNESLLTRTYSTNDLFVSSDTGMYTTTTTITVPTGTSLSSRILDNTSQWVVASEDGAVDPNFYHYMDSPIYSKWSDVSATETKIANALKFIDTLDDEHPAFEELKLILEGKA
jgi:hypothetical protein